MRFDHRARVAAFLRALASAHPPLRPFPHLRPLSSPLHTLLTSPLKISEKNTVADYLSFYRRVVCGENESAPHAAFEACRRSFPRASDAISAATAADPGDALPATSDFRSLEFLAALRYDVPRALLFLSASLGAGAESKSLTRLVYSKEEETGGSANLAQHVPASAAASSIGPGGSDGAPSPRAPDSPRLLASGARMSKKTAVKQVVIRGGGGPGGGLVLEGRGRLPPVGPDAGVNADLEDLAVLLRLLPRDGVRAVHAGSIVDWLDGGEARIAPHSAHSPIETKAAAAVALPPPPPPVSAAVSASSIRGGTARAAVGADEDDDGDGGDTASDGGGGPLSEAQKARRWTRWLALATSFLASAGASSGRSRPPSWAAAVTLRAQALGIPRLKSSGVGAGPNAPLATSVTTACRALANLLGTAVRWRARLRDAIVATPRREPEFFYELAEKWGGGGGIDLASEIRVCTSLADDARSWTRAADAVLARVSAAASTAAAAELLHAEDNALALLTAGVSAAVAGGGGGGGGGAGAVGGGTDAESSEDDDAPTATERRSKRAGAGSKRGGGGGAPRGSAAARSAASSAQPPPVSHAVSAVLFKSRAAALATAAERAPPVPIAELRELCARAAHLPVALGPGDSTRAAVLSVLARVETVARAIIEHVPFYASHYRTPAGFRVPQGCEERRNRCLILF